MSTPTALLDFFKRGEVARDVRLLAAQGALAPRAHEQLAILVHLVSDRDPEIRRIADETLSQIPTESVSAFLGRADVSDELRDFFARRGIMPSETPADDDDTPFVDTGPDLTQHLSDESTVAQHIAKMSFTERLRAAMKGSREVRALLIRDANKMIATSVLSSPKITESEVESFARMPHVAEDVLRLIGGNRSWTKNYQVIVGLSRNPKTPVAMSLNFLSRLNDRDLALVSIDRNVPEPLRIAARRKVVTGAGG